jgi:predicted GIY-YIG superfamily endonuclease
MEKPVVISLCDEHFYEAEKLYLYDKLFFNGCSRIRSIIDKKRLTQDDYIFGYIRDNIWVKSSKEYQKAKLLIKEEWAVKNVPKLMAEPNADLYKYEEAPFILELTNEEKFKDLQGNIIEIEVRGERKHNNCYFKVRDVMDKFEMPNLNRTLNNKENNEYKRDIHYKTFIVNNGTNHESTSSTQTGKTYMYLTYNGMLKVLFSSRSGNAEAFQSWASEKLFTVHLGEQEDKDVLASELLGVNTKTIKDVFKTNSSKTPVVYLYLIGNPNELLKSRNDKYNNDDLLCKYGCTDDLERRCTEHDKQFKKEFNKNIELLCFSIIEAKYIFEAESNIKQYFKSNTIEYKNTKELIVINKKDMNQIKQHYRMIQNSYIGRYEEMHSKISLLEKEILELNNRLILKDKDIEILTEKHNNELQMEKHKNELKDKDIQLLEYKIKLLELTSK